MLIDNIKYLKEKYPQIREKLKAIEESENRQFQIEETRKGDKTLSYTVDGKKQYFHSKYDPIREAEVIAEEYTDLGGKAIVFYGTGLGYHIEKIISNNPGSYFYIFEPNPELLEVFLSEQNLTKSLYKNLRALSLGGNDIDGILYELVELHSEGVDFATLPSHKKLFAEDYKKFFDNFLYITRANRMDRATKVAYQKKWTINMMKNLKDVLMSPNIFLERKGAYSDKPAIIVSAGPSLNEEIENLRYIKDNGLAYIFSVGSAINTLVNHGIYPHATAAYDPEDATEINIDVLGIIKEKNIAEIPLIFGSSIGHRTLEGYPGEKYHVMTARDTLGSYYAYKENETREFLPSGPSIAILTLQLLANLGFKPIILAGQNLAYLGDKDYAEGISYYAEGKSYTKHHDGELQNILTVEDVYGNQIKTAHDFNVMRKSMERTIKLLDEGHVINTTKGGAKIEGTVFKELKDIISADFKTKIVEKNWIGCQGSSYSKETVEENVHRMNQAVGELAGIIRQYSRTLENMFHLLNTRNYKQLELMYDKLNMVIEELSTNVFFMIFIVDLSQIYYDLLENAVKRYKMETNTHKRHEDLLEAYKLFIKQCNISISDIETLYQEMNQEIMAYLKK